MRLRAFFVLVLVFVLPLLAVSARADSLATAANFAVLAGSTVTNTGPTVITGGLGVSPGSAVTGFPPGTLNGTLSVADAVALQAQSDLTTAFNTLGAQGLAGALVAGGVLTGTYSPGAYFAPAASLTGTIFLNDGGVGGSLFIFFTDSTLVTASSSKVDVSGLLPTDSVYWVVGSSATLGTATSFEGNILALASITMNTGATIGCGRALAQTGAVTLDTNTISIGCGSNTVTTGGGFNGGGGTPIPTPGTTVPEPGTFALLSSGLLAMVFLTFRK